MRFSINSHRIPSAGLAPLPFLPFSCAIAAKPPSSSSSSCRRSTKVTRKCFKRTTRRLTCTGTSTSGLAKKPFFAPAPDFLCGNGGTKSHEQSTNEDPRKRVRIQNAPRYCKACGFRSAASKWVFFLTSEEMRSRASFDRYTLRRSGKEPSWRITGQSKVLILVQNHFEQKSIRKSSSNNLLIFGTGVSKRGRLLSAVSSFFLSLISFPLSSTSQASKVIAWVLQASFSRLH